MVALTVTRPLAVSVPPATLSCVPESAAKSIVVVVNCPPEPSRSVPALMLVAPPYALLPVRTSVPAPAFARPAVLLTGVAMVAVAFVPSALTVTVGVPDATEKVKPFEGSPPPSMTQLPAEEAVVSPKMTLPSTRGESSRTTFVPEMLSVLKSAVLPAPLATALLAQFTPPLQKPPLVSCVHVPLTLLLTV